MCVCVCEDRGPWHFVIVCVCLCPNFPSHRHQSYWIRGPSYSNITNYICNDPFSKQGHILRYWWVRTSSYKFGGGGHKLTHNCSLIHPVLRIPVIGHIIHILVLTKQIDCQILLQQRWVYSGSAENCNLRSATMASHVQASHGQVPTWGNAFIKGKRKLRGLS